MGEGGMECGTESRAVEDGWVNVTGDGEVLEGGARPEVEPRLG